MKTRVRPYEIFQASLPHLLAYVIGKAAVGDESAIKAIRDWEATCPKVEVVVDVLLVVGKEQDLPTCGTCGRVFVGDEPHVNCGDFPRRAQGLQAPPHESDDDHVH